MAWTSKHEDQLRALFGGEFKGRMGSKSWMGPMLEHAQTMGLHPVDRSREYMPVAPQSHEAQRAAMDISDDAMRAAREERRIRAILRRVDDPHVRVLRLAYTPQPRGATPALVVDLLGTERAAALAANLNDENATVRRDARRALAGAARWATGVLERAQVAYADADAAEAPSRGAQAARAFARSMGGAP